MLSEAGTEPYGRGARSQTEMVSGRGDRKPLCNLVRLEIGARDKSDWTELYLSAATAAAL